MNRYIDADKLLEQIIKKKPETAKVRYTEEFNDAIMRVRSMIHSAPTADVVEVRHGKWGFDGTGWTCSECDKYGDERYKYCPHCGAAMDGGAYD